MTKMVNKEMLDVWEAIRAIRNDVKQLQDTDKAMNLSFLNRSYDSIVERLDVLQREIEALKAR